MIHIHPTMNNDQLLDLFDEGTSSQWSHEILDWTGTGDYSPQVRKALANLITPVYLGEQTAMMGVSAIIPMMLSSNQPEAALFLSTMGLDEGRHFRNLHQLYALWEEEPLSRHRLPEMWRYQARLMANHNVLEWLWGILISDLFAKQFYGGFAKQFAGTLLGNLSEHILVDENRHQAFSEIYLESMIPNLPVEAKQALLSMRDDLFRSIEILGTQLEESLEVLQWRRGPLIEDLWNETERWANSLSLTTVPI